MHVSRAQAQDAQRLEALSTRTFHLDARLLLRGVSRAIHEGSLVFTLP